MKIQLAAFAMSLLATGLAWGDTPHNPAANTASAVAAGAASLRPAARGTLTLPRPTQGSNVIELSPIDGNLSKGLPKYGPGWRLDPIINVPGLGSGVQNGSATGPR